MVAESYTLGYLGNVTTSNGPCYYVASPEPHRYTVTKRVWTNEEGEEFEQLRIKNVLKSKEVIGELRHTTLGRSTPAPHPLDKRQRWIGLIQHKH